MADYFLNELQLNTGNVEVLFEEYSIDKSFNNYIVNMYHTKYPSGVPLSGSPQTYSFTLTLRRRNGVGTYEELLETERALYAEIGNQVVNFSPALIRSDTDYLYFSYFGVYVLFDSVKSVHRATDYTNFITLALEGVAVAPYLLPSQIFGVSGFAVASAMVGGGGT